MSHSRGVAILATLGIVVVSLAAAVGPARRPASASPPEAAVGLSLFFRDGAMAPVTLVGDARRYLQEVDIVATTAVTSTDQGIAPLLQHPEFARLNWQGVHLVEEDWRPEADGTWTLQRFYRGAHWMEQPS